MRKKRASLFDRAYGRIEDRLARQGGCRYFLPVSSITRDAFLKAFPVDPDRVRIVSPGVDAAAFQGLDRDACRGALRRRFGLPPESVVVLFVSMNFEIKGLDHVMAGFARAREQDGAGRLELLVVGKGDEKAYRRMAETLKIDGHVHFAGVIEKGIESIYLGADAFILLSRFDTFALVVLEAMAAAVPVIVSRQVGAKDIVADGANGFVVDRGDAETVGDRLRRLCDPERRSRMAARARDTAARYSWDATAETLHRIYRRCHEEKQRAPGNM